MKSMLRNLPLLMLTVLLLSGTASCGDEPQSIHSGNPIPVDTTRHNNNDTTSNDTTGHGNDTTATDTTHHNSGDTTTTVLLTILAPRDYGYMGQTLQLAASTSSPATVTWRSLNTSIATIDKDNGMVTFGNVVADGSTLITAMAAGATDTIMLVNRCWKVASWDGNAWTGPSYLPVHQGDTLVFTISDSQSHAIDDQGFNAAACQWSATSPNGEAGIITTLSTGEADARQRRFVIAPDAPVGAYITIVARYGDAASSLMCVITR